MWWEPTRRWAGTKRSRSGHSSVAISGGFLRSTTIPRTSERLQYSSLCSKQSLSNNRS